MKEHGSDCVDIEYCSGCADDGDGSSGVDEGDGSVDCVDEGMVLIVWMQEMVLVSMGVWVCV